MYSARSNYGPVHSFKIRSVDIIRKDLFVATLSKYELVTVFISISLTLINFTG